MTQQDYSQMSFDELAAEATRLRHRRYEEVHNGRSGEEQDAALEALEAEVATRPPQHIVGAGFGLTPED